MLVHAGTGLGIFGGVRIYDFRVNWMLLPMQELLAVKQSVWMHWLLLSRDSVV